MPDQSIASMHSARSPCGGAGSGPLGAWDATAHGGRPLAKALLAGPSRRVRASADSEATTASGLRLRVEAGPGRPGLSRLPQPLPASAVGSAQHRAGDLAEPE